MYIDDFAFWGCSELIRFNVDPENRYYSSADGVLFNKDETKLVQFPAAKEITEYYIPDGVIFIESLAFRSCNNLNVVSIPQSCEKKAGKSRTWGLRNPFENCKAKYVIRKEITYILYTDESKTEISSISTSCNPENGVLIIPSTVTTIGKNACVNNINIKAVDFSNCQIKTIDENAFEGCVNLNKIILAQKSETGEVLSFNTSLNIIGKYAFCGTGISENNITEQVLAPEQISIDKLAFHKHTWAGTENPCIKKCSDSDCGMEKVNHIKGNAVIENDIKPQNGKPGSYDLVFYCKYCGKEISREIIPVTSEKSGTTKKATEATIRIEEKNRTVKCGETITLVPALTNPDYLPVVWTSSSDCVDLSVSYNSCTVEGVSVGRTVITVKLVDRLGNTVAKNTYNVTVKPSGHITKSIHATNEMKIYSLLDYFISLFKAFFQSILMRW